MKRQNAALAMFALTLAVPAFGGDVGSTGAFVPFLCIPLLASSD